MLSCDKKEVEYEYSDVLCTNDIRDVYLPAVVSYRTTVHYLILIAFNRLATEPHGQLITIIYQNARTVSEIPCVRVPVESRSFPCL